MLNITKLTKKESDDFDAEFPRVSDIDAEDIKSYIAKVKGEAVERRENQIKSEISAIFKLKPSIPEHELYDAIIWNINHPDLEAKLIKEIINSSKD